MKKNIVFYCKIVTNLGIFDINFIKSLKDSENYT